MSVKAPFTLDSKEPDWSKFQEFLHKEVRYTSLLKMFPTEAQELFAASEADAKWRYDTYKRYAAMDYTDEKNFHAVYLGNIKGLLMAVFGGAGILAFFYLNAL